MGKKAKKASKADQAPLGALAGGFALPKPLRKGGKALVKWLKTPEGRQVLGAGLAAMATALASNRRVRAEVADVGHDAAAKAQQGAATATAAGGALAGLAVDLAAEGVRRLVRGNEARRPITPVAAPKDTASE